MSSQTQLILGGDPIGERMTIPRNLSAPRLCQMYKVTGMVTKTSQPQPSLRTLVTYNQERREHQTIRFEDPYLTLNPTIFVQYLPQDDENEREYGLSEFVTMQRITVQDCPEHVPQGRMPKSIQVILTEQLVDKCKSGDRVEVVGTLLPSPNAGPKDNKSQSINVYILATAVNVTTRHQIQIQQARLHAGEEECAKFLQALQDLAPKNGSPSAPALELLSSSLSPSLYGHDSAKRAIVLQLLGGIPRHIRGTIVRGDINIMLAGAPGCGKSQLLRAALQLSEISLSASGRGASGAGLTAAVMIDKDGQRSLQAGAFVLADGGLLCIDEFDKLQQTDRAAIHEAMEQQTVSVAKAGIHATLNARCSVLAAANYAYGQYDNTRSLSDNMNLPDSLLSRFDLIFRIDDKHDADVRIAQHVLQNHMKSISDGDQNKMTQQSQAQPKRTKSQGGDKSLFGDIPVENFAIFNKEQHQELLARFKNNLMNPDIVKPQRFLLSSQFLSQLIKFCKDKCDPQPYLTNEAVLAVAEFYARLRRADNTSIPVTARALEALIRLSTALAKLSWPVRDVVKEDVVEAYILLRHSMFNEPVNQIRNQIGNINSETETMRKIKSSQQAGKDNQQQDENAQLRYDLFVQAFGEIAEQQGAGGSLEIPALRRSLSAWINERRELGQEPFTDAEIRQFVARMAAGIAGMVVDEDVIYF